MRTVLLSPNALPPPQFLTFIICDPFLMGPLARIERLFRLYDTDKDNALSPDEVMTLLSDVESEAMASLPADQVRPINFLKIKIKARSLFKKHDANKVRDVIFCVVSSET